MEDEEIWRRLPHFFTFSVSSKGRVKNLTTKKLVAPYYSVIHDGEPWVEFENDSGSSYRGPIWRLILVSFYDLVDWTVAEPVYRDGDVTNLDIYNLRWIVKLTGEPIMFRREDSGDWRRITHYGKRVMVMETGIIYRSVRECARELGLQTNAIYLVMRGERKTHHGLTFKPVV